MSDLVPILLADAQAAYVSCILFIAGLALILTEIFIPGVIMGLIGLAGVIVGVVFGYQYSTGLGVALTVVGGLAVPGFILLWVKLAGPALAIKTSVPDDEEARESKQVLIDQEGVAITMLRPAGVAQFGDRRVDVVTDGEVIEANTRVTAVDVRGNRVVVRAVQL